MLESSIFIIPINLKKKEKNIKIQLRLIFPLYRHKTRYIYISNINKCFRHPTNRTPIRTLINLKFIDHSTIDGFRMPENSHTAELRLIRYLWWKPTGVGACYLGPFSRARPCNKAYHSTPKDSPNRYAWLLLKPPARFRFHPLIRLIRYANRPTVLHYRLFSIEKFELDFISLFGKNLEIRKWWIFFSFFPQLFFLFYVTFNPYLLFADYSLHCLFLLLGNYNFFICELKIDDISCCVTSNVICQVAKAWSKVL